MRYAEVFQREEVAYDDLMSVNDAKLLSLGLKMGPRRRLLHNFWLRYRASWASGPEVGSHAWVRRGARRAALFAFLILHLSLSSRLASRAC